MKSHNKIPIQIVFVLIPFLILICNLPVNDIFRSIPPSHTPSILEQNGGDSLPKTASDYSYNGIGAPWNATHWANSNETNQFVSFTNGTSGMQSIPLGMGWTGYQLNANITNLHDQRNWVNDSGMKPATIYRVYNVSQSFHPYRDNRIVGQEVSIMNQSGALYMRAHFVNSSFDQYYDYMYIFNDTTQTNRYLILDGIRNDFYSPWTMGNILEVTYDSNNTGHSFGYYIDYYEFVNSSSNWQTNNDSWNFNYQNSTIFTRNNYGAGNIGNATAMWVGLYGGWISDNDYQYYQGDFSELYQNLTIPRGRVIDAYVSFDYYVQNGLGINTNYIYLSINSQKIYSKGMGDIINGGTGNNTWHHSGIIDLPLWVNSTNIFNPILNGQHLNLTVGFMSGGTIGYSYFQDSFQNIIWFDNVTLEIKSETMPNQIGLNLNSTSITTVDWGKGTIRIDGGNWSGNLYPFVTANFSSTDTWNLSSYTIELNTDLNLLARKDYPDTNYETNANSLGTAFSVSNATSVNWACYAYFSVPTGYAETFMALN
ncbi:MAG TPA: hypothetical protein VKK79_01775, partial [Candidatus Lokiarchaeia archaeon]|nr:hypothetical protein [Candidatus Lokiarchaeia archaeon]